MLEKKKEVALKAETWHINVDLRQKKKNEQVRELQESTPELVPTP